MRPSMFMGAAGLKPAAFVGSAFQVPSENSSRVTLNLAAAGAQVGDYCLVHVQPGFAFPEFDAGGEGWQADNFTWAVYSYRTTVFRKRLTSLAPVTIRGSEGMPVTTLVYRGAAAAQRRVVYQQPESGPSSTPGFVPSPSCVRVVGFSSNRDTTPPGGSVTSPGGVITKRREDAGTFFRVTAVDALKSEYVNNAPINWPGAVPSNYRVSQLYELLIA